MFLRKTYFTKTTECSVIWHSLQPVKYSITEKSCKLKFDQNINYSRNNEINYSRKKSEHVLEIIPTRHQCLFGFILNLTLGLSVLNWYKALG